MKAPLVNGCYDQATFRTLTSLGVTNIAFDIRARSPNLVTYKELAGILPHVRGEIQLIFENDSRETITSYLDLLKPYSVTLQFRDKKSSDFYSGLNRPFIWYFSPEGEWMKILSLKNCQGVILPLKYQSVYHDLPHLWTLIEANHLRIWLHAESSEEAKFFEGKDEIQASLDLSADLHSSYRKVDDVLLKTMKFWRKINESAAGQ